MYEAILDNYSDSTPKLLLSTYFFKYPLHQYIFIKFSHKRVKISKTFCQLK